MFDHIFGLLTGRSVEPATSDDHQLRICVAKACPQAVRDDCAERLNDVESQV